MRTTSELIIEGFIYATAPYCRRDLLYQKAWQCKGYFGMFKTDLAYT